MSLLQAVILWQVYAISSSTLALGLVGLIGFIAALLSSLIGGAVVDAYDRRVVLLAAQLVPGLGSIVLLAAIATDIVSLGLLYGVVLVSTLAASFEFPARQAILPSVVPARLFTRSLATNSALSSFGSVTGPALGGLLIAFGGIGQAYAAHVLLVVLSTATLVQLRVSSPSVSG